MDSICAAWAAPDLRFRWRRRRLCVLIGDEAAPAALRHVSARRLFLETNARPPVGATVQLRHPEAGTIAGAVTDHAADGVHVALSADREATAFALAAIAADMSRPA